MLPVTETIINRVHELADKDKANRGLQFGDSRNDTTISDLSTDENQEDDDASDGDYTDTESLGDISLRADSEDDGTIEEDPAPANYYQPLDNGSDSDDDVDATGGTDERVEQQENMSETGAAEGSTIPEDTVANDNMAEIDEQATQTENGTGETGSQLNNPNDDSTNNNTSSAPSTEGRTRSRRAATYIHPVTGERQTKYTRGWVNALNHFEHVQEIRKLTSGHANKHGLIDYIQKETNSDPNNLERFVNHMLLTQYGIKKGLELFEQEGVDAVLKELKQMHNMEVVEPLHPSTVTKEMRQRALNYLMFLKRKKSGEVKGRGCADGRKQRLYVAKEDAAAPTVATPALFISCLQDAVERRIVVTLDVPGAFLQTQQPDDDEVIICFEGPMVDALVSIAPEMYQDKVQVVRNGKKILYARAKKAIYGTVRAAYLFWLDILSHFKAWGFVQNPYDQCTVNRMFGKDQCTIQWHVDDLKISCRNAKVIEGVISKLNKIYGKTSPLTITQGDRHEYLGMTIDYSTKDRVTFTMYDYVNQIIESLPKEMQGTAVSPAGDHLFKVNNENGVKLNNEQKNMFHHYTAQLLFIAKRARPDLQTAVAFLCTRVHDPDQDDFRKLTRVMKYLQFTPHLPLILGSDGKGNIYWSVDAAFAVHSDMRGHTGAQMSLGQGTVVSMSSKQKINTRSSTEAELVGVDQPLPMILWSKLFCNAQGMNIKDNVLYQDNESAIRMEKNGKASCTKRTKHIEIRYFYITDKVKAGEVSIEYCPTKEMIGDYFTKPLAGSLFKKLRDCILGINDGDMGNYRRWYKMATEERRAKEHAILNKNER